jgi:RNA polymerase sigma-70 factor, ECF subfamily
MFFSRKTSKLSDNELIDGYKKTADRKFLGELFLRYSHLLYGITFNYFKSSDEAQDAVMDIFEQLGGLLTKHEIKNFRTWVHSVAKNHCLMKLRAEKTRNFTPFDENENIFMENEDFFHLMDSENNELSIHRLESALEELEHSQKICIKLFYIENKSYQEIYQITGMDFKKVKSCIQNGKRNLKIRLLNEGINYFN